MQEDSATSVLKPMPLIAVLSIGICLLTIVEAAQTPVLPPRDPTRPAQSSPARIRGRIVAGDTGLPLGRAQVTLAGPSQARRTLTDAEGRYEFTEVPAGTYAVNVSKTGYVNLQYGQRRPFEPGRPVTVADGRTIDRIDLSLPRGAVIAVRVTDDLGFPMSGVEVRPQRYQYRSDGQRSLATIFISMAPTTTDDRGEVRLFGLMPGDYVVSAVSRMVIAPSPVTDSGSEGFAPTYYPGVIAPSQASAVSLGVGEEKAVQFSLVRSRLARVSGVVVDSEGRPANGARVSLSSQTQIGSPGATIGVDGTFSIGDIPPGEYDLLTVFDALEEVGGAITVTGADISDLRIVAGPGANLSGRLVFDGRPPQVSQIPSFRIVVTPVRRALSPGLVGARTSPTDTDGRFGFTGITGRILVGVTAPDGWGLKSVVVNGENVTNTPIELRDRAALSNVVITVTNRLTSVAGQVTDARGQPAREYVVVMVPDDAYDPAVTTRRVRALRPGSEGTYTTRGMMPGRYVAVAVEALEEGQEFSPEFHRQVRRLGQEFTLREGESSTLNLRLQPDL